jgi:hypothetical protein
MMMTGGGDDDDNDGEEYTNLSFTSASCSFYSYIPHFPSSFFFIPGG